MLTSLVLTYGNRRNGNVEARLSKDDGKMWDAPLRLFQTSGDMGYPSTVQLPDGRMVTVFYARQSNLHAPLLPASFAIAQSPSAAALSPDDSSLDLPDRIVPDGLFVNPHTFVPPLPPEQVAVWYGQIREVMYRKHVPDAVRKPLAVTEWGYSTAGYHASLTPQVQAEYVVRAYLVSLLNSVTVVNLYELCDNPTPPANSPVESSFGIFTKDFADKPAAVALRTMVAVLRGCRLTHRLATDNPDDYVAVFDNGGKRILATWTSAAPHPLKLAVSSGKVTVTDLLGSRRETPATEGHITLELTGGVQYVEV